MSVDHKVFVCCGKDKALEVYSAVKLVIDSFWYKMRTDLLQREGVRNYHLLPKYIKEKIKTPEVDTMDFNHFWLQFSTEEENRQIFMTHSCPSDYEDIYKGDKIIFSIGHWGQHEVYMDIIKEVLKDFGDVYEDVNDCDDIDFIKVN